MQSKLKIIVVVALLASSISLNGQGQNTVWCFGDSVKIHFNKNGTDSITKSSLVTRGTCASICDTTGKLLFYAETQTGKPSFYTGLIWNKENNLMINGDSIAGTGWYKQFLIIPNSVNDSLFYLFSASVTGPDGFFYSVIDISQDSGRGAVIQKNVQLQGTNFYANDGIAAIKHGNGRDWWVMVRDWQNYNNKFYYYAVTPAGISLDHVQYIGDTVQLSFYRIEPSVDGQKIACCTNKGLISVFDFDRCSGLLSNEISIEKDALLVNLAPWYWDCELSPNKRYLYVSEVYSSFDTTNYLLRFDLQAANIPASRDTLYAGEQSAVAGLIELAPDGKIYWACAYNPPNTFFYPYPDSTHNYITDNLSVINYPDSSFCDFQPFSFYLGGKRTYYGLPNNPNYSLGRLLGSPCDTLQWVGTPETPKPLQGGLNAGFIVKPNPFLNSVTISIVDFKNENWELKIFDVMGKEVLQQKIVREKTDLDLRYLNRGIYFVMVYDGRSIFTEKVVKL